MTAAWMLYTAAVGLALGAAAWVAERALLAARRAARWAWTLGLAGSVAVPVAVLAAHMVAQAASQTVTPGTTAGRVAGPWMRAAVAAGAPATAPGVPAAMPGPVVRDVAVRGPAVRPVLGVFAAPTAWRVLDRPLAVVWAFASTVLLARLAGRAWATRRAGATWPALRVDGEWVRVSTDAGPAVLGALRPVVVLPGWALGDPRLPLMLAHEREHVGARDPLLLAAASLACVLAPWNPALWWQRRRLRDAVELDCDQRTLRRATGGAFDPACDPVSGAAVGAYGRLLLDVAARVPRAATPGLALTSRPSTLCRRITVMTAPRAPRPLAPTCAVGAALLAVLAAAVPRPAPAAPADAPFSRPAHPPMTAGPSPADSVAGLRRASAGDRESGPLGPDVGRSGVGGSGGRVTFRRPSATSARVRARAPGALRTLAPVTMSPATAVGVTAADTTPAHPTARAGDGAYRAVVHDSGGTVELTPLDAEGRPSGPPVLRRVVRMDERSGARSTLDSVAVVVDGHALQNYLRSFRTLPPDRIAKVRVSPGTYVAMHDSAGQRVRGPAVDLPIVQITTTGAAAHP